MKEVVQKYVKEMLETVTIREKSEYVLGRYEDRIPVQGLYLRAKKGTPLKKIEKVGMIKFNMEADFENYVQEARAIFFQKLEEYLNKNGEPKNKEEEDSMFAYVYSASENALINMARWAKSSRVIYNSKTKEYSVIQLLTMDEDNEECEDIMTNVEIEVARVIDEKSRESFNEFRQWFNENKANFLTKKQLKYLEDKFTIDEKNRARINRTISERTYRQYTEDKLNKDRIEKLTAKTKALENVLNSKNRKIFMNKLVELMRKEQWLVEELYTLSFDTCAMMTKACKELEYEIVTENVIEIKKELYRLYSYFLGVLEGLVYNTEK